jgi:hypothetical protein
VAIDILPLRGNHEIKGWEYCRSRRDWMKDELPHGFSLWNKNWVLNIE